MRIGELELDPYLFDDEEYISLNILIDRIEVLTAYTYHSQPIKEPFRKPVKQTLYRFINKEKEYFALKNIYFGK